jgi:hypothetical protein
MSANLEIPSTAFAALRALLEAAGFSQAIRGELLDLHGITLRSKGGPPETNIEISTLLSSRTKEGRVELAVDGQLTQMDLTKAREIVDMLQDAIEAAVSDELIYKFLTQKIGLDEQRAGAALLDFRELRQGSRGRVYPS